VDGAGAVDQNIESSVGGRYLVDGFLAKVGVAYVADDCGGPGFVGYLLGTFGVAVNQRDGGAGGYELAYGGGPHAGGSSGDYGDAAG
jgi:hypothetical protein